jgi:DNA-directed RNA polymerase subunit RPC12/RpoP
MEILLALATVVVVALALALAPGRLRRTPARPARRPASGGSGFLGVCASCAEIVESGGSADRCPACGGPLAVHQRIIDTRRAGARQPVA